MKNKKVLLYLYFPLLEDHCAGGAQQVTRDLVLGLADLGFEFLVLSPNSDPDRKLLQNPRVRHFTTLRECIDRPLALHEHRVNWGAIADLAAQADIVWSMDRALPLRLPCPIILTLGTIAYELELQALCSLNWDSLIVPSRFLEACAHTLVSSEQRQGKASPIRTIPFFIDQSIYTSQTSSPAATYELLRSLELDLSSKYLLFPNRPDPEKGMEQMLVVLQRLNKTGQRYKLLVPTAPLSIPPVREQERRFLEETRDRARTLGIESLLHFHRWISPIEMPEYYRLGYWSLNLSRLPEGFGRTVLESVSCGTPIVTTRCGSLGELLPERHGATYVALDDIEAVVAAITRGRDTEALRSGSRYITEHYNKESIVSQYAECLKTTRKRMEEYRPRLSGPLQLAPWCMRISSSICYNQLSRVKCELTKTEQNILDHLEEMDAAASSEIALSLKKRGILI